MKVNIMRFHTLRSIEFQGLCSRKWNISRSENSIFVNLLSIRFLPMTYSCIKRQCMKIYKADYSRCIIEKDVKVNIMRFRALRSIEFKGLCSRNWNLLRSENYIFGIYGP